MKKAIFLLAFILAAYTNTHCQTWAPIGATWTYGTHDAFDYGQSYRTWTSIDTITMAGHICKIITRSGYALYGEFINTLISYEDSNVLYFLDTTTNQFNVLYDYNKNAGESWTINFDTVSTTFTVDSVGTTIINGNTLKTQYVHHDYSDYNITTLALNGLIIQHLGYNGAMMPYLHIGGIIEDMEIYTGLRCYSDSNSLYIAGIAPSCDYTHGTLGIEETTQTNISIYPNPTNGYLYIETENPALIKEINLSNLAGQLLINNGTNLSVSVENLPAGTYLLQVKTAQGNFNKLVNKLNR